MDRIQQLDAIIEQYNLNGHPFYQAWRMGTLPVEKLADYSGEYGRFVATIAEGWDTLGQAHYAEEEREHELFWNDFKAGIGAGAASNRPQTDVLVTAAKALFGLKPEAIGALYAFEAQQPYTSKSKLDGLNEHYTLSDTAKKYFVVHADDVAEIALLRSMLDSLSEEEFARVKSACATVCTAMWGALDGVYYSA
jgi:pyrroloquinoline-quinone synthase